MRRRTVLVILGASLAGCLGDGVDARGSIEVVVDGQPVDLSADRFQAEYADDDALAFHLHEGDDDWYMEGDERVTVAEAIDLLPEFGYETDRDGVRVTIDGATYHTGDPDVRLRTFVDGDRVDPETYRLRDGDALRIELESDPSEEDQ